MYKKQKYTILTTTTVLQTEQFQQAHSREETSTDVCWATQTAPSDCNEIERTEAKVAPS